MLGCSPGHVKDKVAQMSYGQTCSRRLLLLALVICSAKGEFYPRSRNCQLVLNG